MLRLVHRSVPGWFGFFGATGALFTLLALTGCPGTLDPDVAKMASGGGATTGTGGSATGGTGGGGTGGSTGTGGTASNCTGAMDGATLVTNNCATTFCHIPGALNDGTCGGLDLTVDANIASRLIGVLPTGNDGSVCGGTTKPYLDAGSNPATGLLIDKMTMSSGAALCPGGASMPFGLGLLPTAQRTCIQQWAEGLIMANP
jgi:hypothetical protein